MPSPLLPQTQEAVKVLMDMKSLTFAPNVGTYNNVLAALGRSELSSYSYVTRAPCLFPRGQLAKGSRKRRFSCSTSSRSASWCPRRTRTQGQAAPPRATRPRNSSLSGPSLFAALAASPTATNCERAERVKKKRQSSCSIFSLLQ
jgi:hypothetical protein